MKQDETITIEEFLTRLNNEPEEITEQSNNEIESYIDKFNKLQYEYNLILIKLGKLKV